MMIAFTPSVFHRSMKLSSCACAAVVSVAPPASSTAVVPVFTPMSFSAGVTTC